MLAVVAVGLALMLIYWSRDDGVGLPAQARVSAGR
jgi:hypothetical protein